MKDLCYINTRCDSEDGSVRPWRFPQQVKSTGTFSEFLTEINHFSSKKKLKLGWVKLLFYPGKIKIKKVCKLLFWVKMLIWEIIFFLKNLHTQLIHKQVGDVEVGDCFGQSNLKMIACFFLGDSVVLWFYRTQKLNHNFSGLESSTYLLNVWKHELESLVFPCERRLLTLGKLGKVFAVWMIWCANLKCVWVLITKCLVNSLLVKYNLLA